MNNHKRWYSVSNHHSISQITSNQNHSRNPKHRHSQPFKESIYHSKAKTQECSLSHSFYLSNEHTQSSTVELKRKNSVVLAKKKMAWAKFDKETSNKNQEQTPFQKRKRTQKKELKQKIQEIHNRRALSFILEESVKNWLVISELKPTQKAPDVIELESKDKELSQKRKKGSLEKSENYSVVKGLGNSCERNRNKNRTEIQSKERQSSLQELRIFNCTVDLKKQLKSKTQYIKNSFLVNQNDSQKRLTLKNHKPRTKMFSPEHQKISDGEVIKCSKIDFSKKGKSRPQTAILKIPKTHFWTKPEKKRPEKHELLRQITGWQDLTDSFDKQILF